MSEPTAPEEEVPAGIDVNQRVSADEIVKPINFDYQGADIANKKLASKKGGTEFLSSGSDLSVAVLDEEAEKARQEELARTDTLTGLPNRRQFDSDMEAVVARFKRGGYQFGVLSVDLKKFKEINDTRGHPEGDKALVFFSDSLKKGVRQGMDKAYRIGGDEFAVISEGVNQERGQVILDHLELHLAEDKKNYPEDQTIQMVNMNKSIKVWTVNDNVESFMQALDKKMYEEKRGQESK